MKRLLGLTRGTEANLWNAVKCAEEWIEREPDNEAAWDAYDRACEALDRHYDR